MSIEFVESSAGGWSFSAWRRPGSGVPFVFLHGLGSDKLSFFPAANSAHLRDRELIAIDLPGSGSSASAEFNSLLDVATLIRAALDQIVSKPFVLVGHSLGGAVGLRYAQAFESELAAFANVEGNLTDSDCFLSGQIAAGGVEAMKSFRSKLLSSPFQNVQTYADRLMRTINTSDFLRYSRILVAESVGQELLEQYAALRMPRAFVCGALNAEMSTVKALLAATQDVQVISESGHSPHAENPDEFYSLLLRFARSSDCCV